MTGYREAPVKGEKAVEPEGVIVGTIKFEMNDRMRTLRSL